jgi:hypothetical protein
MSGEGTKESPWELTTLGLIELEHNPRNNRARAL